MIQNRIEQLDFPKKQQTALDILRDFMFFKGITVIEHGDLCFADGIVADESDLTMFRYNKKRQEKCEPRGFCSFY